MTRFTMSIIVLAAVCVGPAAAQGPDNLAIWTEDGFIVENVGVPPDMEVEYSPADVIAGRDPQLERAIEWILAELERNPQQKPARPAFPIRVRREP